MAKITTTLFKSWDDIPDVSHLLDIEDSYVKSFDRPGNKQISCISYAVENDKVIAFGSATYFEHKNAIYYIDDDDEYCYLCYGKLKKQYENRLWIEGLVSTKKGCGSKILLELEKWLGEIAMEKNAPRKVINVMSVNNSAAFYEKMGYTETCTGPRFAGTDNVRLIKALPGFNLDRECIFPGVEVNLCDKIDEIAGKICQNRTKGLETVMNIPDLHRNEWLKYFQEHCREDFLYKDIFTKELREQLIDTLEEYTS